MNKALIAVAAAIVLMIGGYAVLSSDDGETSVTDSTGNSYGDAAIIDAEGNTLLYSTVNSDTVLTIADTSYMCNWVSVKTGVTLTIELNADLVLCGMMVFQGGGTLVVEATDGTCITASTERVLESSASVESYSQSLHVVIAAEFRGVTFKVDGAKDEALLHIGSKPASFADCTFTETDGETAIYSESDLTFTNCTFDGCECDEEAYGTVYTEGDMEFEGCVFKDCGPWESTLAAQGAAAFSGCSFTDSGDEMFTGTVYAGSDLTIMDCTYDVYLMGAYSGGALVISSCEVTSDCGCIVSGEGTAVIEYTTFSDCTDSSWSALTCYTPTTLTECTFSNCYAKWCSGAVYGEAEIEATGCTFENCGTNANGGAVYCEAGAVLTGCTFTGCYAEYGGAVYACGSGAEITNCTFTDCTADYGGAIMFYKGTASNCTIAGCTFTGCSAKQGGAAYTYGGMAVSESEFIGCSASTSGGALGGSKTLTDCTFSDCTAESYGGALCDTTEASGCVFTGCSASKYGGAAYGALTLTECSFSECSATTSGGAAYASKDSALSGCDFTLCLAETSGGAVYAADVELSVEECEFTGCSAKNGGALYVKGAALTATGCSFEGNAASSCGGAIYSGEDATVTLCSFSSGEAEYGSAIYWMESLQEEDNSFGEDTVYSGTSGRESYGNLAIGTVDEDATYTVENVKDLSETVTVSEGATLTLVLESTLVLSDSGYIAVYGDLIITGEGGGLEGSSLKRSAIKVYEGGTLTATDCVFENFDYYCVSGGAVYSEGNLQLEGCTFTNCGTYSSGSSAIKSYGGAVYSTEDVCISGCTFTGCSAYYGGAVYCKGFADVSGCTFEDCTSKGSGGGMTCTSGANVTDCTFIGCYTGTSLLQNGGGLLLGTYTGEDTVVTECTFTGCSSYNGGGLMTCRIATISDCTFENCDAYYGGGIYLKYYEASVSGCSFTGCSATYGGAACMIPEGEYHVYGCSFEECTAEYGGALYVKVEQTDNLSSYDYNGAVVESCTFVECTAETSGNAIYGTSRVTLIDTEVDD